jgi:hypothetical protein
MATNEDGPDRHVPSRRGAGRSAEDGSLLDGVSVARGVVARKDRGVLLPRPSSGSHASGALLPWPAVLVTWGPGGASRLHAHHCWHLFVGLDADLSVTTRARGRPRRAGALITAPDAPHAVDARGTRALIVFVEPESDAGEHLLAVRGHASVELFRDADADRLRALLSPEGSALADPEGAVARALSLGGEPVAPPPGRHPGVRRILRYLRHAAPETDTSLTALAELAGLSPGRFMHAFTETVGVPLRPYLRWLKLARRGSSSGAWLRGRRSRSRSSSS